MMTLSDSDRRSVRRRYIVWWLLTIGEGLHNDDHAAPQSARHCPAWYEFHLN